MKCVRYKSEHSDNKITPELGPYQVKHMPEVRFNCNKIHQRVVPKRAQPPKHRHARIINPWNAHWKKCVSPEIGAPLKIGPPRNKEVRSHYYSETHFQESRNTTTNTSFHAQSQNRRSPPNSVVNEAPQLRGTQTIWPLTTAVLITARPKDSSEKCSCVFSFDHRLSQCHRQYSSTFQT
jgi:hypothetical protein